jgi:hypothetical protein
MQQIMGALCTTTSQSTILDFVLSGLRERFMVGNLRRVTRYIFDDQEMNPNKLNSISGPGKEENIFCIPPT